MGLFKYQKNQAKNLKVLVFFYSLFIVFPKLGGLHAYAIV